MRAYGPLIKQLTDPANFEHFRFMPVTRDLTPGQRTLLYNFLDGGAPLTKAAPPAQAAPQDAAPPDFHKLSQAMRGKGS